MKLVVIESPYAGEIEANVEYARRCAADALKRGEAPFLSHLLYTQPGILNDLVPEERELGIQAGIAWARCADLVAVYTDRGVSRGMEFGVAAHVRAGRRIVCRSLSELVAGRDLPVHSFLCRCLSRGPCPLHDVGGEDVG